LESFVGNIDPKYFKYGAILLVTIYVWKIAQKNGGTLQGNPQGIRLNGDKVVDTFITWSNLNPTIKPFVSAGAKKFMQGLMGY
jgi:hypothetical protein